MNNTIDLKELENELDKVEEFQSELAESATENKGIHVSYT